MSAPEQPLTRSDGDYLKAIYRLTRSEPRVSTQALGEFLQVKPASVTGKLQKLSRQDPTPIIYHKHHGASLTADGERHALRIIRRHRLLELFLVKYLGYAWEDVHCEADELEHVISQAFEDRLAHLLGQPEFDPHGDPIPGPDLELAQTPDLNLEQVSPGKDCIVRRVDSCQGEVLVYLGALGILPGVCLRVLEHNPLDHTTRLVIGEAGTEAVLGKRLLEAIYIEAPQPA